MKANVSESLFLNVLINVMNFFSSVFGNIKEIFENSLIGRGLSGIKKATNNFIKAIRNSWELSKINKWFSAFEKVYEKCFIVAKYNKDYTSKDIYSESTLIKILEYIIRIVNIPVRGLHKIYTAFSSSIIGRVCGILSKLAIVKFFRKILSKIFRRITLIYVLMCFPYIDFLLRDKLNSSFSNIWDECLMLLTILVLAYGAIKKGRFSIRFSKLYLPFFLYIFYCITSLLMNAPDRGIAIEGLRVDIEYIIWFFFLLNMIKDKEEIRSVLKIFVFINIFVASYGIYQYFMHIPIPKKWISETESYVTTRAFSVVGSCNILGSLNMLTIPIAYSLVHFEKRILMKIMYIVSVLSNMACLVFTMSRGAWLAFILVVFVYATLLNRKLFLVGLFGAFAGIAAMPAIAKRMVYMFTSDYAYRSANGGRIDRWKSAVELANNHPVLGQGLGRYGGAVAQNHWIPGTHFTDNYYVKVLAELGYGGLIVFVLLMGCVIYEGFTVIRLARKVPDLKFLSIGIYSGIVGVIAHNCVENIFEGNMMTTYFMAFLGMLIAIKFIINADAKKDEIIVFDK